MWGKTAMFEGFLSAGIVGKDFVIGKFALIHIRAQRQHPPHPGQGRTEEKRAGVHDGTEELGSRHEEKQTNIGSSHAVVSMNPSNCTMKKADADFGMVEDMSEDVFKSRF